MTSVQFVSLKITPPYQGGVENKKSASFQTTAAATSSNKRGAAKVFSYKVNLPV